MSHRTPINAPWILFVTALAGCAPSQPPLPSITEVAREVFPPFRSEAARKAPEALDAIYIEPEGAQLDAVGALTVTFNQPIIALDTLGGLAQLNPLRMEPAVEGRVEWIGAHTLRFTPEAPWPAATPFTAWLTEGLEGLEGGRLEDELVWTFATPRPRILSVEPRSAERRADTKGPIVLRFNQPIDLSTLRERLALTAAQKPIAFNLRVKGEGEEGEILVIPNGPLPMGVRVEVTLQAGIRGVEGLLPSSATFRHAFETHGPLQVVDSGCMGVRACSVEGEFAFVFSTPLAPGAAEHVRITPEPPAREGVLIRVEGDTLRISGALVPDERYKVDIDEGIRDTFGQTLERPWTRIFRAGDYAPSMALDARDAVLGADQKVIAAQFVNVARARFSLAQVDEASLADAWRLSRGEPVEVSGALSRVRGRAITTGARPNVPTDLELPLELASGVGLISLEASVRGARWEPYDLKVAGLVQKTDLGLQVWTDYDQMLVWLTRISDAEPLARRRVALRSEAGALLWEGMTDSAGVVIAPGLNRLDAPPPFFLIAGQGGDFAFRRIEGRSAVHDRWLKGYRQTRFARTPQRLVGQLLTDRGLYRPGDTAHVEGILRLEDRGGLKMLPAGAGQVAVTVFNPMDRQTLSARVALSPQGAFHVPVKIDAVGDVVAEADGAGHLGTWRVEAAPIGLPGVAPQGLSASFLVERRRAMASFEVTVEIPRQHHLPGGALEALVRAEHAFGAPLQGAELTWTLRAAPGLFEPEGQRGFDFSPLWTSIQPPSTALLTGRARLDEGGQATLSIPLDQALGDRSRTMRLDVEIADELGQLSAASATTQLHPAAAYFGLGLDGTLPDQGRRFEVRIIAARPHGQRAADLRAVVLLERARRVEGEGAQAAATSWEEIDGCEITTLDEPRVCAFTPLHSGRHRLRVTGADEYGNPMAAAVPLLVQPQGPSTAEPRADLEITLDRDTARVGQSARLFIQAPFKGRAMLTLARLGLIEHRDLGIIGPEASIDIPVTDRSAPNLEVAVAIIKGSGPDGPPAVAFDSTSLRVALDRPRIDLRVLPDRQVVAPGAEATFSVRAADAEGRPVAAEVSVAVIDEAALALASQGSPDPLGAFWSPKEAELAAMDLRQSLVNDRARAPLTSVRERGAPLRDPWAPASARDALGPAAPLPILLPAPGSRQAREILFHDAMLATDEGGSLQITFKTPNAPGTAWRVVAQARADGHRFGAALGALSLEGPLGVEIVAPAFARVGDRLTTQALVRNPTDAPLDVLLSLEAPDREALAPEGPSQQRLTVPPRTRRGVAFGWRALRPGQAEIALRASADAAPALTQRARAQLTVLAPAWVERRSALGVATGALSQPFNLPDGLHAEIGGLELTFGAGPVALQELADQLLRLPPVGLDHNAARLIAALALASPQLKRQSALSTNPDGIIKDSLDRVLALQRRDGGFSPWLDRPSSARATAFALLALRLARERGVAVPEYAISAALDRAEEALHKRIEPDTGLPLHPAELAFTAAVLADIDPGRVRLEPDLYPLVDRLDALPAYARICVALATRARLKRDDLPPQAARILDDLADSATPDNPDAAFSEPEDTQVVLPHPLHTDLRTAAIVLHALHRLAPDHPLVPSLRARLMKAITRGQLLNAHELAFTLLAMQNAPPSGPPESTNARLWIGQRFAFEATLNPTSPEARSTFIPMRDLLQSRTGELVIAATGAPVHYRASLLSLPADLRPPPVDRGVAITRDHVNLNGATIDRARAGQLVLVRLTIAAAAPFSATLIEVPLAAGTTPFGPLNARKGPPGRHPAPLVEHAEHHGDRIFLLLRDLKPGVYEHTLTLRAILPGDFTLPPTTARDHARPERFGQSPVSQLTILPHPTAP